MELAREIFAGLMILILTIGAVALIAWTIFKRERTSQLVVAIRKHFRPRRLYELTITERQFPPQIRADLVVALEEFVGRSEVTHFTGVESDGMFGGVDFTSLLNESFISITGSVKAGPPQYEHIDVGENEPLRVLKSGLWLVKHDKTPLAILAAPLSDYGGCGVKQTLRIQVASSSEPNALAIGEKLLAHLE